MLNIASYVDHGVRGSNWTINDYISEYTSMANSIVSGILNPQALVGPSVCCQVQGFQLTDVFNAGFLNTSNSLAVVTVQHYPNNNCAINGQTVTGQQIFPDYLSHTNVQALVELYKDDVAATIAAGKELVMLEMNTASCGGFPGLSDSFGAAMW